MQILHSIILSFLLLIASSIVASAKGTLVLVVDLSASISQEDVKLQMESYATAMEWITPLEQFNIEAIIFGKKTYHISSGSRQNAARAFRINQSIDRSSTCLHKALSYVEGIYDSLPQPVIIDISGDGEENCDYSGYTHDLLDRLEVKGAIVNTLMIPANKESMMMYMDEPSFNKKQFDLKNYYQSLIRGPGSFSMYIENFYDFEEAIIRKIVKEIALLD